MTRRKLEKNREKSHGAPAVGLAIIPDSQAHDRRPTAVRRQQFARVLRPAIQE